MYNLHDPLLELEKSHTHKRSLGASLFRTARFLGIYLALTGTIFMVLLGALNAGAYSSRIMNWVNPDALLTARDEVASILSSSSVEVHASEEETLEKKEDLEGVKSKILLSDPEIVYAREYEPKGLLSHLGSEKLGTTFNLTPYENRIVIPRIGENIPLLDTKVASGSSFETMHETFMEELRGGVVRYPGTALPGEMGNVFVFGHSSNYPWVKSDYNDVFALLDTLENGDEITIYYNQKKFTYRVTDRAVVKPGDVKTLESRDHTKKELSLMTCWPIGTTLERIIIFAELVENK
jgi:LPXTG-site transpeptidase (sortase) family protein